MLYFVCAPPGQQLFLRLPAKTVEKPELERKYGVRFESDYALDCFDAYMANRCQVCAKRSGQQGQQQMPNVEFGTFSELRAHMAQAHKLSFCHICCEHLNVLCKDRRVYNRHQLQLHMSGKLWDERNGFRGHPTCQFCEQRFYDDEQHYRHLRKEHYICQFCDQDGREHNVFYRNQHQLNQHNRRFHHACSDPECLQMGIVFRTDVELDVHRAKQHSRLAGSGRVGNMIPVDIQFSHTSRFGNSGGGTSSAVAAATSDESARVPVSGTAELRGYQPTTQVVRIVPSAQAQSQKPTRIVRSTATAPFNTNEFPGLPQQQQPPPPTMPYGAPPGWTPTNMPPPLLPVGRSHPLSVHSKEQFPTLGGDTNRANSSSATGKNAQKQAQNTIWGQKSNRELFAPKTTLPESSADGKKESEQPKRSKFVAAPECWPEHMLEKLKAREEGLPDPDPIKPPHWLNPPKKEKKRKSKTVPVTSAANKIAAAGIDLVPSSSKFNPLAAYDESNEEGGEGKKNWWSAGGAEPRVKLAPSSSGDPDFVQIQLLGSERRPTRESPLLTENEAADVEQSGRQKENEEEEDWERRDDQHPNRDCDLSLPPPPGFPNMHTTTATAATIQNTCKTVSNCLDQHENKAAVSEESLTTESNQSSSSIIHLTMRSIASALFGGGAGIEEVGNEAEQQQSVEKGTK